MRIIETNLCVYWDIWHGWMKFRWRTTYLQHCKSAHIKRSTKKLCDIFFQIWWHDTGCLQLALEVPTLEPHSKRHKHTCFVAALRGTHPHAAGERSIVYRVFRYLYCQTPRSINVHPTLNLCHCRYNGSKAPPQMAYMMCLPRPFKELI